MADIEDRICVLVVSHNFQDLTDRLCDKIKAYTKGVAYDLHVIETGSALSKFSKYATCWVHDKVRMTRGFNILKDYADRQYRLDYGCYFAYQLFVNDAQWLDGQDMITSLYQAMKATPDCGQIHPYQTHIRYAGQLLRKHGTGIRPISFSEIVCPMIRGAAWRADPQLLNDFLFYGWGLDYEIPYRLARANFKCYHSDDVGITHQAGTTYRNANITQEQLRYEQFKLRARENMYEILGKTYGEHWPIRFLNAVPEGVSPQALYDWLLGSEREYEVELRQWANEQSRFSSPTVAISSDQTRS
jgi:hypothetical protein